MELTKTEIHEWMQIPTTRKFLQHLFKTHKGLQNGFDYHPGVSMEQYTMNRCYLDGYSACIAEYESFINSAVTEKQQEDDKQEQSEFKKEWGIE